MKLYKLIIVVFLFNFVFFSNLLGSADRFSTQKDCSIIFVHIGDKLPNHLEISISQAAIPAGHFFSTM